MRRPDSVAPNNWAHAHSDELDQSRELVRSPLQHFYQVDLCAHWSLHSALRFMALVLLRGVRKGDRVSYKLSDDEDYVQSTDFQARGQLCFITSGDTGTIALV
jgi:hypothetical protein